MAGGWPRGGSRAGRYSRKSRTRGQSGAKIRADGNISRPCSPVGFSRSRTRTQPWVISCSPFFFSFTFLSLSRASSSPSVYLPPPQLAPRVFEASRVVSGNSEHFIPRSNVLLSFPLSLFLRFFFGRFPRLASSPTTKGNINVIVPAGNRGFLAFFRSFGDIYLIHILLVNFLIFLCRSF